MKLLIAKNGTKNFLAVKTEQKIFDLTEEWSWDSSPWQYPSGHPFDDWKQFLATAQRLSNNPVTGRSHRGNSMTKVEIKGPAPLPRQIFAAARNYHDWVKRAGVETPTRPSIFAKWSSTICGPEAEILVPHGMQVTYEAEVGVVMARKAYRVKPIEALDYVAGYTIYNDYTAVNLIREDHNLQRAKNLTGFGSWGPFLSVGEWNGHSPLKIELCVNNVLRQSSDTDKMIFNVAELISYISSYMTLWPGDLIATGSPAGVAQQWTPPCYLRDGDVVEAKVEGLGILRNTIREIPSMTESWRNTDED